MVDSINNDDKFTVSSLEQDFLIELALVAELFSISVFQCASCWPHIGGMQGEYG